MPIKLPKGFARRKSSGNVLEDVENLPETSSFRVLERPSNNQTSFDGGARYSKPIGGPGSGLTAQPHQERLPTNVSDDGRANSYRGSGGSNTNSTSTGKYYDNGSSSTRLSSSSTIPSSTDGQNLDDVPAMRPKAFSPTHPSPPPPPATSHSQPTFSLRAAGRALSFGVKSSKSQASTVNARAESSAYGQNGLETPPSNFTRRDRTMTESSYASTATPPKLETELSLSDFGRFEDMFDGLGKRKSAVAAEPRSAVTDGAIQDEMSIGRPPPKSYSSSALDQSRSRPISSAYAEGFDGSPQSVGSRDGLMSTPNSLPKGRSLGGSNIPYEADRDFLPSQSPDWGNSETSTSTWRQSRSGGLRRSSAVQARVPSMPIEDEDARLVMDSVNASRVLNSPQSSNGARGVADRVKDFERLDSPTSPIEQRTSPIYSSNATSPRLSRFHMPNEGQEAAVSRSTSGADLFDSEDPDVWDNPGSSNTTPKAARSEISRTGPTPGVPEGLFTSERSGDRSSTLLGQQKKVMTPAQFEKLRQEHEFYGRAIDGNKSDESEEDEYYDDDDETERNRQLAKQRRRQEAHLAVYRQQMKKVTGEQPKDLPEPGSRPVMGSRAGFSAPNLSTAFSNVNLNDESPKDPSKSSDDEDDDVPLGILAAHGFPNKNRPPTSLSMGGAHNRSSSQLGMNPTGPGSVNGEPSAATRSTTLPAFARNLPQDPYYGAGLVNSANRESLAFGNHGHSGSLNGSPTGLPPGGLVGVIAGEERARAMRRGSPNAQAMQGSPFSNPNIPGSGRSNTMMGPPPSGFPSTIQQQHQDQSQYQMSQQMTQMMQMQMQWMQQVMQGMQMQGMQNIPPPPFAMPPHQQHNQQPQSPQHGPQQPPQPSNSSQFLAPMQPGVRPVSMEPPNNRPPSMMSQSRTMSMMNPPAPMWNHGEPGPGGHYAPSIAHTGLGQQGYAPSIAPSERSNVGMPSRYRPVSSAGLAVPQNQPPRSSTFTSDTTQTWLDKPQHTRTPSSLGRAENITTRNADDDDDDEGWEEMRQKRERKKSAWRLRKEPAATFNDAYFGDA